MSLLRVFVEHVCYGNGFGGEHKFGWTRAVRWVGVSALWPMDERHLEHYACSLAALNVLCGSAMHTQ